MGDLMGDRILVVDDSRPFRQSLNRFLAMEGFEVVEAEDGCEGLEQYRRTSPDLVLMDLNMPRMNGLEAIQRLRETSIVPVLILSARDEEMDKVLGLSAGADCYLSKPFSASELLVRVRALLRRRAGKVTPADRRQLSHPAD